MCRPRSTEAFATGSISSSDAVAEHPESAIDVAITASEQNDFDVLLTEFFMHASLVDLFS
jgi:hypothetical protein